jgi:hypothetical protein
MNPRTFAVLIVAVLFTVLTVTTAAGAACAWVLWQETTYISAGYTAMLATTENDCNARKVEYERRPRPETIDKNAGLRYVCLPDTVDPRGPKGK